MPRYLDVGVDTWVQPDIPRPDSRPPDLKLPDVLRADTRPPDLKIPDGVLSSEASTPDVWPLGEMKVPDALHTH